MTKQIATKWKSTQLMTARDYEINFYRDKDLKTVSMHSHDFYELYYFMQGSVGYIVENGHYNLQKGDILLISPITLHQLSIEDSPEAYERIVLWLHPKFISNLSTKRTDLSECFKICSERKNYLIRNSILSGKIQPLLLELYERSASGLYGDDIEAEMLLKNIFLILCRHVISTKPEIEIMLKSHAVAEVTDYINAHLSENLNLETLAQAAYVSKYHLAHQFKKETGITPYQYIVKKRLILSKRYIEEKLPITEVYIKCGFNDYSNFFRAFKQEYGITPKEYFKLISR